MADHYIAIINYMILKTMLLITAFLLISWQIWEEYHYGDDPKINIFSTGDYKRISQ